MKSKKPFTISELLPEDSSHLAELKVCLSETHPTYEPHFGHAVTEDRREQGDHDGQVFQVRQDLYYGVRSAGEEEQEILVWHPPSGSLADVPSRMLAWFGGLPRSAFLKRYGEPEGIEPTDAPDSK